MYYSKYIYVYSPRAKGHQGLYYIIVNEDFLWLHHKAISERWVQCVLCMFTLRSVAVRRASAQVGFPSIRPQMEQELTRSPPAPTCRVPRDYQRLLLQKTSRPLNAAGNHDAPSLMHIPGRRWVFMPKVPHRNPDESLEAPCNHAQCRSNYCFLRYSFYNALAKIQILPSRDF